MVSNLPDLSLDLSPPESSRPGPNFLTRFPIFEEIDCSELQRLDEFIKRLEDELTKIRAFKRELPLSFLVLNDAIGKLKEEASKRGERQKEGKFDEIGGVKLGNDRLEKRGWMSSAQLWSPRNDDGEEDDRTREWQPCKYRGVGGAFSYYRESAVSSPREDDGALPGLSLVPPGLKSPAAIEPGSRSGGTPGILSGSVYRTAGSPQNNLPYGTGKKRRRSWSPELHRRFVDALEKLGGSQVATPKEIRELMQVDGLTNDEVKSHLQKYRLHVRKHPMASKTRVAMDQDRVALGCLVAMDLLHSSSPEGPLHLGRSGKCNSTSMEDQDYDDDNNASDNNSDGGCWNDHHHP